MFLLLDSGANHHVCGNRQRFKQLVKLKKEDSIQIETARGIVYATHKGTVKVKLDNELVIQLGETLYWKDAPNLISAALDEKDISVLFRNGLGVIKNPKGEEVYSAKKSFDGVFVVNVQVNCLGCMKGKAHINKISKKKKPEKYETLELLVADCMGPFQNSVNKKKGILIISDANCYFCWKSEVPQATINILSKIEREFPGKIKKFRSDNGKEFLESSLSSF